MKAENILFQKQHPIKTFIKIQYLLKEQKLHVSVRDQLTSEKLNQNLEEMNGFRRDVAQISQRHTLTYIEIHTCTDKVLPKYVQICTINRTTLISRLPRLAVASCAC